MVNVSDDGSDSQLPRLHTLARSLWISPLEVRPLGDRQALEVATQAVEVEFDRTQSRPP